jgi:formate-dependent nitrite reductase membrane component NrfD
MAPYLYPQQERPLWKTWLVSILLTIVPIVGSAMAIVYIYSRKRPHEYVAGQAALAGLILILNVIVLALIVYAVIAALGLVVG